MLLIVQTSRCCVAWIVQDNPALSFVGLVFTVKMHCVQTVWQRRVEAAHGATRVGHLLWDVQKMDIWKARQVSQQCRTCNLEETQQGRSSYAGRPME